jgi:hypothetical protein
MTCWGFTCIFIITKWLRPNPRYSILFLPLMLCSYRAADSTLLRTFLLWLDTLLIDTVLQI